MSQVIPALRPDAVLSESDDPARPGVLTDATLGRRLRLDPRGLAIARALDAPQTVEALAARVGEPPEVVGQVLTFLDAQRFLATPEALAIAADARAIEALLAMDPAEVPLLIRDDARFTCTMCGSCCGGHNIGPVFDDVLVGLADKLEALTAKRRITKSPFLTMSAGPGETRTLFNQRDGSCVFLDEDGRCQIHADYGAEAKPRACRIFPYEFTVTPEGIAVTIQRECRGFPEARHGKRLVDDVPNIRKTLAIALAGLNRTPNLIRLADGAPPISFGAYSAIDAAMHSAADVADASDADTLIAMRRLLFGALGGEPPSRRDTADTLRADLEGLTEGLRDAVSQLRGTVPPDSDAVVMHAGGLDQLDLALAHLVADFRRVMAPLERPDQRALFREHLHHALASRQLARAKNVRFGLARFVLGWLLAKAFAIGRARQVKRRHLVAQDVMDGVVMSEFMLRHESFEGPVLGHFDPGLAELLVDRLPALVACAADIAPRDDRAELIRF